MKINSTIIFLGVLVASSLQAQAAELCNGGFEEDLACWDGLTEEFGFKEVISSYTDGRGITFTATEGSHFLNLWGNNDIAQVFSWKKGDLLTFDFAVAKGTNPATDEASLFVGLFNGIEPIDGGNLNVLTSNDTTFQTYSHIFTQDSPEHGQLAFQAQGVMPFFGLTNEEVGHILIDNVQVASLVLPNSVPSPNTLLLISTVLLFGWFKFRTRLNQAWY